MRLRETVDHPLSAGSRDAPYTPRATAMVARRGRDVRQTTATGTASAPLSKGFSVYSLKLPPNPAKPANLWRLAWSDEFNGPPCDPANPGRCSAKDWQKTVQCYGTPDAPVETVIPFAFHVDPGDPRQWTTKHHPHLANLDKCTWLVSDHVNKIHFQGPAGPITRYSPNSVTVSNGEMRITTRRTPHTAAGPSILEACVGSEGTMGVIT